MKSARHMREDPVGLSARRSRNEQCSGQKCANIPDGIRVCADGILQGGARAPVVPQSAAAKAFGKTNGLHAARPRALPAAWLQLSGIIRRFRFGSRPHTRHLRPGVQAGRLPGLIHTSHGKPWRNTFSR